MLVAFFVYIQFWFSKVYTLLAQFICFFYNLTNVQQCLGGNATPVQAGTANGGFFDNRDLGPDIRRHEIGHHGHGADGTHGHHRECQPVLARQHGDAQPLRGARIARALGEPGRPAALGL